MNRLKYLYVQSIKKKKPINSNTRYRRKVKLVPINMNYCLLQFDALKSFLILIFQGKPPNLTTNS